MGKTEKPPVDIQHICRHNNEIIAKLKDADWNERLPSGCLTNPPNDIAYMTDFELFEGNLEYSFDDYSAFFKLKKATYKEWKEVELIPYNTKYGVNPEKIIDVLRILHGGYNAKIMGEVVLGFTPVTWWSAKPIIVFMPYKADYAVFIVAPLMGSEGANLELESVTIDETIPFVEPVRVPFYYDLKTQTIGYSYNDEIVSATEFKKEWDIKYEEYEKRKAEPLEEEKIELKDKVGTLTITRYFFGGFGNYLAIISGNLYILKEPAFPEEKKVEAEKKIRESFAWIKRKYEEIPFSELKKSPFYDDFKPLFEIKKLLPTLEKELEKDPLDFDKIEGLIGKIAELGREYAKIVNKYYNELTGKNLGSESVETRALLEYNPKLKGEERIIDQARWLQEQGIEPNSFEKAAMDYYGVEVPEEEPPWRRLLDVIKDLEKEHGLEVPEDVAIATATEVGIEKPEDLVYELKRDGILYSPAKGLIARVEREKPEEPPAKEPWMMTYREFFDIAGSEYTAGERFGVPTNENGIPINPEIGYPIKGATSEERIHRAVLMKALKEGKPVPEEVLKDYPDLIKKPPEEEIPKIPEEGITEEWMEEAIKIDNKVTPEIVVISTGYAILLTKYIPELKDYVPFYTIERKTIPEVEEFVEVLRYENVEWVLEDIVWSAEVKRNREIWYKEYTEEELRDKKVDEIREIAKIKNLSTKGKKSDLIARITAKPPKERYFWKEKEVPKEEYERLKREEEEAAKAEIEKRIKPLKPLISEAEAAITECDNGFETCLEFCDDDLEECYKRCHEEYEDTKDLEKCRKECEKERDKCHDKCEEGARECYEDSAKEVIEKDIEEGELTKAEEDLEMFMDYISDELYKKLAEKLPKKVVEEERVKVRVLEDIPTFMGTDGEIYELKKGDTVELPKSNADVLCERGVAEPFVERPPEKVPEKVRIHGVLKTRYRCPICYRAAPDNFCMVHSDVEAIDLLAADEPVKEAVIDLTFWDLFKTKHPEKKRWTLDELHDAIGIDIDYAPEFLDKPRIPETYAQYYARELGVEIVEIEEAMPMKEEEEEFKEVREALARKKQKAFGAVPVEDVLFFPSVIIIAGKRRSGKTALGFYILEIAPVANRFVLGMPEHVWGYLPEGIKPLPLTAEILEELPVDSIFLIDEASLSFYAKTHRTNLSAIIDAITLKSAQRGQTFVFVSHNLRKLQPNIILESDILLFKEPSLMQVEMERREIIPRMKKVKAGFDAIPAQERVRFCYMFSDDYSGLTVNPLPSFWRIELSEVWRLYTAQAEMEEKAAGIEEAALVEVATLIEIPYSPENFEQVKNYLREHNGDSFIYELETASQSPYNRLVAKNIISKEEADESTKKMMFEAMQRALMYPEVPPLEIYMWTKRIANKSASGMELAIRTELELKKRVIVVERVPEKEEYQEIPSAEITVDSNVLIKEAKKIGIVTEITDTLALVKTDDVSLWYSLGQLVAIEFE